MRALFALMLLATAARAQSDLQLVQIEWTRTGWAARVATASGQPSASEPDLFAPELPDGQVYFELRGGEPAAVLARGLLVDPARATLDPEEDGVVTPPRTLEAEFARAFTQVRLPASPPVARLAIRRARAGAAPETVFEGPVQAGAAPPVGPTAAAIGANGLGPNRVGVLFAGDGFLREDYDDPLRGFDAAVEDMKNRLLSCPPFDAYGHLLAFARVKTESATDGISVEDAPDVSTYFGARLIHARKDGQPIANGGKPVGYKRRVLELPDAGWNALLGLGADQRRDVVMLLLNESFRQTGLSIWGPAPLALTSSTTGQHPSRFVHQMGHVIGGLGDEHTSTPPFCRPDEPAVPNVDTRGDRTARWGDLIEANAVAAPVAGGQGCGTGRFHPTATCIMRGDPPDAADFCAVCREAIVDGLYARVKLPDSREPADPAPTVDGPTTFRVRANATSRQTLVAEWTLDGKTFPDTSNGPDLSFTPPPADFTPGRHVVRLLIEDRTPVAGGPRPVPPRFRSMPHEVRWDVTVRATAPAPLAPMGTAFASP